MIITFRNSFMLILLRFSTTAFECLQTKQNHFDTRLPTNLTSFGGQASSCSSCIFFTPSTNISFSAILTIHPRNIFIDWRDCMVCFMIKTLRYYKVIGNFSIAVASDWDIPENGVLGFKTFAYSKNSTRSNITTIPWPQELEFCNISGGVPPHLRSVHHQRESTQIPWDQKINKVVWRGGPWERVLSGPQRQILTAHPRYYVSMLSYHDKNKWLDACMTPRKEHLPYIIALHQQQAHCPFRNATSMNETDMMKYRYILNIPGTSGTSTSIIWKMATGSVVFNVATDFEDWFMSLATPPIPWKHFVPIKSDLSNLQENFHYMNQHVAYAKQMVEDAIIWVQDIYERVNKEEYMLNILLKSHLVQRRFH